VRCVIGMDGGSTSSKAVIIDYDTGALLKKEYQLSKGNPIQDTKEILAALKAYVHDQGAVMEVMGFWRDRLCRRRLAGVGEIGTPTSSRPSRT